MKKYISNILVFIAISYIALFLLDKVVTIGLRKSNAFVYENLARIHKGEINSNLIINGSSKALVQVSPYIIDTMLNFNTYNFGMNGANFELQNLVYELYRNHNSSPDYIIQIVSNETLELNENLHEYKRFAPYLKDTLVRQITNNLNGFSFLDYYLPFFRYSGLPVEIVNGVSNFFNIKLPTDKSCKYKGYIPYDKQWDNSFENFKDEYSDGKNIEIDNSIVLLFNNYIESCLKDGIKILLIYPPTYYESHSYINNRAEIIALFDSIANKHQVPFLNYSEDELSYSKQYFYNSQHLNKNGSELFTKKICTEIINAGVKLSTHNLLNEDH